MIVDRSGIAATLPGYEIGTVLGSGAFGLVLAARHRALDRLVAVKVLPGGNSGSAGNFVSEAQLLGGFDHPHIIRVYDYVETEEIRLIVMELLDGGSLGARLRRGPSPEVSCAIGLAVASALSYAHEHRVLHRDIKPDNILFTADDSPKVTDFGIAKFVDGTAATASGVIGTPKYMAPEQIGAGRLSPATDVYSLAVVLYEMLAGEPPFSADQGMQGLLQQHLETAPSAPRGVSSPVATVVLRALAKDPRRRQSSARTFAVELARAAAESYGPTWLARSGIPVVLSDELRAVARSAGGGPLVQGDPPPARTGPSPGRSGSGAPPRRPPGATATFGEPTDPRDTPGGDRSLPLRSARWLSRVIGVIAAVFRPARRRANTSLSSDAHGASQPSRDGRANRDANRLRTAEGGDDFSAAASQVDPVVAASETRNRVPPVSGVMSGASTRPPAPNQSAPPPAAFDLRRGCDIHPSMRSGLVRVDAQPSALARGGRDGHSSTRSPIRLDQF
jgi:serine/threonine protein kinase